MRVVGWSSYCNYSLGAFGPRGRGGSFSSAHLLESHARAAALSRWNPAIHPRAIAKGSAGGITPQRSSSDRKTSF